MKKESFIAYDEWAENCDDLTDEEFGILMRAVFKYKKTGENPAFSDRTMRACWKPIKQSLDRTIEAYRAKCEQNKKNGEKGGRPRKVEETEKPKKPNGFFENPPDSGSKPDSGSDPYPEPDSEPDPESGRSLNVNARETTTAVDSVSELTEDQILEIIDAWNRQELTKKIYNIHRLSGRENNTRLCIGRFGFDEFLLTISKIDQQAYFRISAEEGNPVRFDWFVRPDNFQKVLEGNYTQEWKHKSDGKPLSVMEEMESWI